MDDPIIERAGEIDDDEPKEESWFDEEGNRQDDNPNEDGN